MLNKEFDRIGVAMERIAYATESLLLIAYRYLYALGIEKQSIYNGKPQEIGPWISLSSCCNEGEYLALKRGIGRRDNATKEKDDEYAEDPEIVSRLPANILAIVRKADQRKLFFEAFLDHQGQLRVVILYRIHPPFREDLLKAGFVEEPGTDRFMWTSNP